ncbi:MAG: hypothetical protein WBH82_01235 [Arcanobacterium sp.]
MTSYKTSKYTLNVFGLLLFFAVFGVMAILSLGYSFPEYAHLVDWIPGVTAFQPHASNFVFGCGVMLLYGVVRIMYDAGRAELLIAALVIAAVNAGYELFYRLRTHATHSMRFLESLAQS